MSPLRLLLIKEDDLLRVHMVWTMTITLPSSLALVYKETLMKLFQVLAAMALLHDHSRKCEQVL